ncbi:MAG: ATP-dependent DNA helicase [Ardenticatenia bacterium]|nr:ATP-dependent DNA helicase [Ardenticatenia bacterium]
MAKPAKSTIAACFASGGALARALPGYRPRASQAQMAEAVWQAIQSQSPALIEAPTGTGKSLAYLIPALASGKTVVVATANKSLQHQLFLKDVPLAARALGMEPNAVLVKGRQNYVCQWKWEREWVERQLLAQIEGPGGQVNALRDWLAGTASGDVDELPFLLAPDLQPRVVSLHDDCVQQACRHFEEGCFVNQMRDAAAGAQVLITNHHLLLTALRLGEAGHRLLPPGQVYIIDEAHHLVDTATAVFSVEVTDHAVEGLLARTVYAEHLGTDTVDELRFMARAAFDDLRAQARAAGGESGAWRIEEELPRLRQLAQALKAQGQLLQDHNPYAREAARAAAGGSPEATAKAAQADEVAEAWRAMKRLRPTRATGGRGKAAEPVDEAAARQLYELAVGSLNGLADDFLALSSARHDDRVVRYAEPVSGRRQVRLVLHASPITPATELAEHLFGAAGRAVICTSATLAASDGFRSVTTRLGIARPPLELVTETVFDYPAQALLYQPALPEFRWDQREVYYDAVAAEIERLLSASRGRALCLFTSWAGLEQTAARLRERSCFWPLRAQGDAPREALLAWFRGRAHSVLLATRAFWEGVDVQGEDLSLVVLDKLPFPSPNDPLHGARMKAVEAAGGSSFDDYLLPQMTLTLKQGFGRLIRTAGDRGVVAILDERLSRKGYGQAVRRALPPAPLTRDFSAVPRFFDLAMGGAVDFALEVMGREGAEGATWRWTLRRMVDGRADTAAGSSDQMADGISAEFYAAVLGLRDLAGRVRRAGKEPAAFSVELRCSQQAAGWFERAEDLPPDAFGGKGFAPADWLAERAPWRAVTVLGAAVEAGDDDKRPAL